MILRGHWSDDLKIREILKYLEQKIAELEYDKKKLLLKNEQLQTELAEVKSAYAQYR